MIYFILWVGLSFLIASFGKNTKLGYLGSLILAIILSPIIGLIVILIIGKENDNPIVVADWKRELEMAELEEYKGNMEKAFDHYQNADYHIIKIWTQLRPIQRKSMEDTRLRVKNKIRDLENGLK